MIGVFDSGFGGLTILREIVKTLPEYSYVYLGDSARAPYGDRSQAEIYTFTKAAVTKLFEEGCSLVVVACNTASAEALRKIQMEYLPVQYPEKKVLGVLIPAAEDAALYTKNKKIGVLATTGTVASKAFERELKKIDQTLEVYQIAAPLLVPTIESGNYQSEETKEILKKYLEPLQKAEVDTLILGCTHYGILAQEIAKYIKGVMLISEGKIVAKKLATYLERHKEVEGDLKREPSVRFLTTGDRETFTRLGSHFFGQAISPEEIIL